MFLVLRNKLKSFTKRAFKFYRIILFHLQICKFVGFEILWAAAKRALLLPLLSGLYAFCAEDVVALAAACRVGRGLEADGAFEVYQERLFVFF